MLYSKPLRKHRAGTGMHELVAARYSQNGFISQGPSQWVVQGKERISLGTRLLPKPDHKRCFIGLGNDGYGNYILPLRMKLDANHLPRSNRYQAIAQGAIVTGLASRHWFSNGPECHALHQWLLSWRVGRR
jgi:hypothetical protein